MKLKALAKNLKNAYISSRKLNFNFVWLDYFSSKFCILENEIENKDIKLICKTE